MVAEAPEREEGAGVNCRGCTDCCFRPLTRVLSSILQVVLYPLQCGVSSSPSYICGVVLSVSRFCMVNYVSVASFCGVVLCLWRSTFYDESHRLAGRDVS